MNGASNNGAALKQGAAAQQPLPKATSRARRFPPAWRGSITR